MRTAFGGWLLAALLVALPAAAAAQTHVGSFTVRHHAVHCFRAPCPGFYIVETDGRRIGAGRGLVIDAATPEEMAGRLRRGVRARGGVAVRGRVTIDAGKVEVQAQQVGGPGGG